VASSSLQELAEKSPVLAAETIRRSGREPQITFLLDGPYGIPVKKGLEIVCFFRMPEIYPL
jgi:hypothetical protein